MFQVNQRVRKNCESFFNFLPFKYTAQKMKFFIKNFFSKCDQIRSFMFYQEIFNSLFYPGNLCFRIFSVFGQYFEPCFSFVVQIVQAVFLQPLFFRIRIMFLLQLNRLRLIKSRSSVTFKCLYSEVGIDILCNSSKLFTAIPWASKVKLD